MQIVLLGVSCVGKTTIGALLAERMGYDFVDFDAAVSKRMDMSVSRLHDLCFNEKEYRGKVKHILPEVLNAHPDNLVLSMPPSGMHCEYKPEYDKRPDILTVALKDKAKNIIERVVFTDDDDNIDESYQITPATYDHYYQEVKEDIAYYYPTHKKAKLSFNVDGMSAVDAARALERAILEYDASSEGS